jgi:DNA polymerase III psi subunit
MANIMSNEVSENVTPDPWMIHHNGTYLLTFTADGNRVEVWRSPLLNDFRDNVAAKRVIWYLLKLQSNKAA